MYMVRTLKIYLLNKYLSAQNIIVDYRHYDRRSLELNSFYMTETLYPLNSFFSSSPPGPGNHKSIL